MLMPYFVIDILFKVFNGVVCNEICKKKKLSHLRILLEFRNEDSRFHF